MACLGTVDCGDQRAREELLFLFGLNVELLGGVEVMPDFTGVSLGFTDVFRSPAMGADNFIRLEKAPEDLLKLLATLRALTRERVEHLAKGTATR